jgi:hypothetical protein
LLVPNLAQKCAQVFSSAAPFSQLLPLTSPPASDFSTLLEYRRCIPSLPYPRITGATLQPAIRSIPIYIALTKTRIDNCCPTSCVRTINHGAILAARVHALLQCVCSEAHEIGQIRYIGVVQTIIPIASTDIGRFAFQSTGYEKCGGTCCVY